EEQRRIAGILGAIDDKIENNRRINTNLELQAQALYKQWFVDFEFPNEEGKPYKSSGGKMVDSELGPIPEGWRVKRLDDYMVIKRGGSPRPIQNYLSNTGLNWLKISDATSTNSPFILEIKEFIKEEGLSKTVFLKKGNLVLSNSATPCIPKFLGLDTCIHDGWLYFPNAKLSKEYLYLLFRNNRQEILSQGNGSVFLNLKTDILKSHLICLPNCIEKMNCFNMIVKAIFKNIENCSFEIKRLATLRDTLLPKLMNGEIKL
ncbi:MAG: restriction endonuclease subunit S, partial [Methanobrevibacter sp.]|nr:restriction endonuclease subunit S [Methanobrevibacter sp.]